MPEKTYQSVKVGYSQTYKNKSGDVKNMRFIGKSKGHSEYTTSDAAQQKAIEGNPRFKGGEIRVKWSKSEKAWAKLKAAQDAYVKAGDVVKEAQAALNGAEKAEGKNKTTKAAD